MKTDWEKIQVWLQEASLAFDYLVWRTAHECKGQKPKDGSLLFLMAYDAEREIPYTEEEVKRRVREILSRVENWSRSEDFVF